MAIDHDKFNGEIKKLRDFSLQIEKTYENKVELVKQLNSLSTESRTTLFNLYQHSEGPVKGIRKDVANILAHRNIQLQELDSIISRAVDEKPGAFKTMYKNWYNILYMLLIADFRTQMINAIEFISSSIIEELKTNGKIVARKFDFTGERETGSTRCWIAFINHTHSNQTTAKQLFLNIENGTISFSFYDRPNDKMVDQKIIGQDEEFSLDDLIAVFQNHKNEILEDTWIETVNYWRIGTKDKSESYWEEMKSENKICIGWSDIGDLSEADIKNKKDIIHLLDEEGYYVGDNRTKSKKAGEIYNFYDKIKVGDIVLAQDGATVLGIGRILSEYDFNKNAGFPHQKQVEWLRL
ncbi:MAG: hypothetical protein J7578_21980, partial [Chitinophagaceae bacterium]|nr:hypothetical protein [Chitinophagaceae bacterium]